MVLANPIYVEMEKKQVYSHAHAFNYLLHLYLLHVHLAGSCTGDPYLVNVVCSFIRDP
jgi:hypothetical protein